MQHHWLVTAGLVLISGTIGGIQKHMHWRRQRALYVESLKWRTEHPDPIIVSVTDITGWPAEAPVSSSDYNPMLLGPLRYVNRV